MGPQKNWCWLSTRDVKWLVLVFYEVANMWFGAVIMGNSDNIKKALSCYVIGQECINNQKPNTV